jgi:hypothetical protein
MKIFNVWVLLFVVFLSYCEVSQQDKALFKAIEKCDFKAVNGALYKGASINAINEATGDNPAFFAVKKLLKTILEANDNCYMTSVPTSRWLEKLTRGAVITSQLISIVAIWSLIDTKVSKQSDFKSGILSTATVAGVFLGTGILEFYVRTYYQNKKIKNISEIVHLLLTSSDLNMAYIHPQIKTDLKGYFSCILNAQPSGEFELVRNYEPIGKFIDRAYKFVLDDNETVYCSQKAYLKDVKPIFEKLVIN